MKIQSHCKHYHVFNRFWCQVEFIQWHKETAKQTHQKTQVNAIFEIRIQIVHFEVQFIQMLIDECDQ